MNKVFRSAIFYLVLLVAVIWVFQFYRNAAEAPEELTSLNDSSRWSKTKRSSRHSS